jgi:nucleoside-diphosphate-sugar epimerase
MKVLFIGGTGVISSACTKLAVEKGIDLTILNRGKTGRDIPENVRVLHADIRNPSATQAVLDRHDFDVVVDWIAFSAEHIETDLNLFRDRVRQYIFISSASAYQTPPQKLPVTEETPLENPYWDYSRRKIICEQRLMQVYREEGFPVTIVRPSHTYDRTLLPMHGRYTVVDRMRKGQKVIVPGDGTSLWVLTHHRDFAKGFIRLLGLEQAISQAYHITSDEILTWNQIFEYVACAAGTVADIVHVPSETIAKYDADWGDSLLGDKSHSMIFDNSKIKKAVPEFSATISFAEGAQEIIKWYDEDPSRKQVDQQCNRMLDTIIRNQP